MAEVYTQQNLIQVLWYQVVLGYVMMEYVVLAVNKDQVGIDSNTDKFCVQKEWLVSYGVLAQQVVCL